MKAFADKLRKSPGEYQPVPRGPGSSTFIRTLETYASDIRCGKKRAFPRGEFHAYIADINGEPVLVAAYIGKPAESVAS